MSDCVFCKIVAGDIPSTKVYEDDHVLGFKDLSPQAPTHYLFIPKKHYTSFADVPLNEMNVMAQIFSALKTVAEKEGLTKRGFRTTMNTLKEGGQSVFHMHVHLMAKKQMGADMTGA